jgi:hypothetical protein
MLPDRRLKVNIDGTCLGDKAKNMPGAHQDRQAVEASGKGAYNSMKINEVLVAIRRDRSLCKHRQGIR